MLICRSCTLMGPYKQISTLSQNVANLRFKGIAKRENSGEDIRWDNSFRPNKYTKISTY